MEHKKTMLDYIADCPEFIRNNVADSAALTKPLVDEYVKLQEHLDRCVRFFLQRLTLCAAVYPPSSEVRGQDRHPVSFCIQRE